MQRASQAAEKALQRRDSCQTQQSRGMWRGRRAGRAGFTTCYAVQKPILLPFLVSAGFLEMTCVWPSFLAWASRRASASSSLMTSSSVRGMHLSVTCVRHRSRLLSVRCASRRVRVCSWTPHAWQTPSAVKKSAWHSCGHDKLSCVASSPFRKETVAGAQGTQSIGSCQVPWTREGRLQCHTLSRQSAAMTQNEPI